MDFKDLLNNIKEIISPEIIAFFAMFYFTINKLFKAFKKVMGVNNEYHEIKKKIDEFTKKIDEIEKKIDESDKKNHQFKNQIIQKIMELMKKWKKKT